MAPLARLNLVHALRLRELDCTSSAGFRAAAHSSVVPSHAFLAVRRPPAAVLRRYTPCGRFLVAVDRNRTDLRLYLLETGGLRVGLSGDSSFLAAPMLQNPLRLAPDALKASGTGTARSVGAPVRTRRGAGPRGFSAAAGSAALFGPSPFVQASSMSGAAGSSAVPMPSFNVNPLVANPPLDNPDPFRPFSTEGARGPGLLPSLPPPFPTPGPPPASSPPVPADYSAHACDFSRFFTHVYTSPIAAGAEVLVPDFCLATARHLILAAVVAPAANQGANANPPAQPPGVDGVRVVFDSITFHLVEIETGQVRDKYVLRDDFVALEGHAGVHMLDDLLCVLSIRHQVLHLLRVHDTTGRFMLVSRVGTFCDPDDEYEISRARDAEMRHIPPVQACNSDPFHGKPRGPYQRNRSDGRRGGAAGGGEGAIVDNMGVVEGGENGVHGEDSGDDDFDPTSVTETGLGNGKAPRGFYCGLMHRLLVHVYEKHLRERNERRFFRVIGQYSMLVMKKAQLLDDDHLLIRLGSSGILDPRTSTCFFIVYCISTSRVVNLYENRSNELLELYEANIDLFTADPAVATMLVPARTPQSGPGVGGNNGGRRGNAASSSTFNDPAPRRALRSHVRTREILAELPVSSQERNPSVYLDRRLFSYPFDQLPALDGSRAMSMRELHSIKFTAAGGGNLRFKLTPGLPNGEMAPDGGGGPRTARRKVLFLFHPTLPFVISMQASLALPTSPLINFHVRDT
jgi:De-etiolated protein 1 Det1